MRRDIVLVELHRLQVLVVLEGVARKRHRHSRGVAALPLARSGIDYGFFRLVGDVLDIGMVHHVLRRCGDDVAAAVEAYLMNVRQDVLAHTFLQRLTHGAAAPEVLRHYRRSGSRKRQRFQEMGKLHAHQLRRQTRYPAVYAYGNAFVHGLQNLQAGEDISLRQILERLHGNEIAFGGEPSQFAQGRLVDRRKAIG